MKRLMPLALTVVLVALILGCEGQIDQKFEPEPDIFALMKSSDSLLQQVIWVDQSYDIKDTLQGFGVTNAGVRISSMYGEYEFKDWYIRNDTYFTCVEGKYVANIIFDPSITYYLEVVYPGGDTVTSETKMPSPIHLSWPKDGDTLSLTQELANPHLITWNNCLNVGLYTIQCVPNVDTSKYDSFPQFLFIPSFTIDTSYAFFQERAIVPWVYNQEYVLRVNAYGIEYASYVKFGLSGGKANLVTQKGDTCFGVFSGIAIDSVRVFITQ